MTAIRERRYCSWCYKKTYQVLQERNLPPRRNVYRCGDCRNYTLECHACENMTRGRPTSTDEGGWWDRFKSWDDGFCAEHDGTIGSFQALNRKLLSLDRYEALVKGDKMNLAKPWKIVGGALCGIAVFGPLTVVGAPAIATALGGWGVLGTASTGTAISSLSGAALTNASLAAVGGGATAAGGFGMAGGTAFITAVGSALGGVRGGVITNSYLGDIKGFDICRLRRGSKGERLVFVNGFLQQEDGIFSDWLSGTKHAYNGHRAYGLSWESKALCDIGTMLTKGGEVGVGNYMAAVAKRASRRAASRLNPLMWATIAADLVDNPWHVAMYKAGITGTVLADLVARTRCDGGHTLMGHSLGARVIYYALSELATKKRQLIKDVVLLGGAVDRNDSDGWAKAATAVRGTIYNCYSRQDNILKCLYTGSTALLSAPIGIGPIVTDAPNVVNVDVTDLVGGHDQHKPALGHILDRIHRNASGARVPELVASRGAKADDVFEVECPYCEAQHDATPGELVCPGCGLTYELAEDGIVYVLSHEFQCPECEYREVLMVATAYEFHCPDCDSTMWPYS